MLQQGSYDNYCRYSSAPHKLSRAEHDAHDAVFQRLYRGILDGALPWGADAEVAAALDVHSPLSHDARPLNRAAHPLSDATLADMAEDQVPSIGLIAPDRVLGPLSEERPPRGARQLAGAVMSFAPLLEQGVAPVTRVIYQKPRPPTPLSTTIRAMARTPPMIWRREGERIAPLLPLAARMIPPGPVPGLPDAPVVIGRAVPWVGGWWLAAAMPLHAPPPVAILTRRMHLELHRMRRHERRLSWEDLLRERGEVLYRTSCEWAWWTDKDAILACWRALFTR